MRTLRSFGGFPACRLVALVTCAVASLITACRPTLAALPDIVWRTNAQYTVLSLAFSPDGMALASGSADRTAKVWSVPGGTLLSTAYTPQSWMTAVALYPERNLLYTGGDDGGSRMWTMNTAGLIWGGAGYGITWAVTFSPNGQLVADAGSDGSLTLRSSDSTGGRFFQAHQEDVVSICFSPDGSLLASASWEGTAKIWSVANGQVLHNITGHSLLDSDGDIDVKNEVYSVDFSPDGTLVLTSSQDGTARIWRVSDGAQVQLFDGVGTWRSSTAKFSADGRCIYTLTDGTIKFWKASNAQLLVTYPDTDAMCLDVSRPGKYFAYGRVDGGLVLARVPLWIESITRTNGQSAIRWQGGSGSYQVQGRTNLTSGDWQNLGSPITNTVFTHTSTSPMFYRVQSITNP